MLPNTVLQARCFRFEATCTVTVSDVEQNTFMKDLISPSVLNAIEDVVSVESSTTGI
jgi:hypothetical protein